MKTKNNKVVLAFSGGLDTSYCVKHLMHDKKLEVHSITVNTGGFTKRETEEITNKAHKLGVSSHTILDETENYYQQIVRYLVFGNVLKNGTYPLSVSSERIHQAIAIARCAKKIGADFLAHGCTSVGNDQVRFDLVFQLLCPNLPILAPIREQKLSRKQTMDYLAKQGIQMAWKEAKYSINKGLWGTSVGGTETLTSHKPLPESAFPSQPAKNKAEIVSLFFDQGELKGINNKKKHPVAAIKELEKIASQYAIGRGIHTGDTIIGIKGRVGFEAAAPMVAIAAHKELEKHTLTKWQLYWKEQLANWYGMLMHEGQYFDPVMRDIETFLQNTQGKVTGTVAVNMYPYRFVVQGVKSENDLMDAGFGKYGEESAQWTGKDVEGFVKIMANPTKIYNTKHQLI